MKISAKILVYFLYVALVPLVSVSVVLVNEASKQLLQDASAKQKAVSVDLSRRVDNYLANDANQLALVARLYSTKKFDQPLIDQTLSTLFTQNSSLQTATLQTSNGIQRTYSLESDNKVKVENSTIDLISSKALDFLVDKPYIMSVGRDDHNSPQVTIGIPILKQYGKADNELFALQSGSAGNIIGALIATYNVSDLWQSVLSVKLSDGGYAYVIDKLGNLVAHPDQKFLATHATLTDTDAVRQVLRGDSDTLQTVSETGTDVISTPHTTMTDWAVIVQEPVSSVYAGVNSYIRMSAFIGVTAIMLTVVVSIFFGRQIIRPIQQLSLGDKRLGQGQLDQKLDIRTNDELQDLAETFNGMAEGIKRLISDLKTNNLRLKFEQIKLNNIISSVSDGVIALNSNGEILSINPPAAGLTGQDARDLEGLPLEDVFKWEHDDAPFALDLKMGGIYHYTDLVLNQAGSTSYMDVMVAVLDHQDSDVAAIVTIHDQTESRELSFMKLDFVAIAAHELRTPLTVVRGYLDLLNTHADTEMTPYNYENLQKTIVGANQLRELINKLLNIARIERGDMEIFPEKLNLSEMVAENVEQHLSVAAQRDQTLHYDSAAIEPVYVPADSASIVEVLNNLIGNAIKYTPKAGQVRVSLAVEDEMVRVTVTDNGPGVPKEQRDRLFTKFYRAERSLIAGTHGTGLGLFISKTIIELQGGRIGLEPDRGEGSTFYFTLPLYNPERDDDIVANSAAGTRGWFKKRKTPKKELAEESSDNRPVDEPDEEKGDA